MLPGPLSATAFLNKIIRFAKPKPPTTVVIKDAINDLPIDWRQKYTNASWAPDLDAVIPISAGIKLCVGSPEKDSWLPAFVTATSVAASAKLPPDQTSYQMFVEGMLLKAWQQCKKAS